KIHENMGTGELNESQPIAWFLGPAGAKAATLCQPTQRALHHPPTSRKLGFTRDRTVFNNGFVATTAMFDMGHIAFLLDKLMDIRKVIAFVKTHMLLNVGWVRPRGNNGNDDLIDQPFIMLISSRNVHRQGGTALIDQNMNFATTFGSIDGAFPCRFASQG